MQQSVLKDFPDADVSVSIVWIQMPGFNDNERTSRKIAESFSDPRVRHFYDPFPAHLVGKAFAQGRISQGPAWDIYFFFKKGQEWTDGPPEPAEWMHQLGGARAGDSKLHTGTDLVEHLHQAMHSVTGAKCDVTMDP